MCLANFARGGEYPHEAAGRALPARGETLWALDVSPAYLAYSTSLRNRFGAVFGCVCRLRREIFISQNRLKG